MKYPNGYFKAKSFRACEEVFTPTAPSQKYCTRECRGKTAYYERIYGISEQRVRTMYEEQDHRCYICRSVGFLIGKNGHTELLAVDHCHDTGKVRHLLCHNCNRALGLMQDNPSLLRSAAAYIEKHREGATTIPKGSTLK
jgi:hypothetical protein